MVYIILHKVCHKNEYKSDLWGIFEKIRNVAYKGLLLCRYHNVKY